MNISERHSDDQLIDRERILEEFTPQNLRLEGQSTLSPDWLSRYIDRLHRTLEDPRFLVLPTSCQLLYVHLLKLTHGIGQSEIAISIDGLTDKTKLSWMSVQKHIQLLKEMGVVVSREASRQRQPSKYLVAWLPMTDEKALAGDMLTRYDQLDADDLKELARLNPLFSKGKREEMATEIYIQFREDGLVPTPDMVRKVISYRLLNSHHYRRTLMKKYPHWFGLPVK